MDIHAPEGPAHSFRDFVVHIGIVTIGILIALALDGLRERLHERHQLRETRALLQKELQENHAQLEHERARTQESVAKLQAILADYPELQQHPEVLHERMEEVKPAGYFFTALTWDTALSTGVLGHMEPEEVMRNAGEALVVRVYVEQQTRSFDQWERAQAFFRARRTLNESDAAEGRERLEVLKEQYSSMQHLQDELRDAAERAGG